jgi:hypothetical protein
MRNKLCSFRQTPIEVHLSDENGRKSAAGKLARMIESATGRAAELLALPN